MRLNALKLTHFRNYRATPVIPIDAALPGIIGRNIHGKAVALEPSAREVR